MPKVKIAAGNYYHVYNRGVNYGNIFFVPTNWSFFLRRLHHYFISDLADIVAYCLMPNHYHLLVFVKTDEFGKRVMQPFGTSYTKAINKQQERVGPLFQGPFKARLVEFDKDLIRLSRYIHLNPVAAGFVDAPDEWDYSSFLDYVGLREGTLPKSAIVLNQFANREAYIRYVLEDRSDSLPAEFLFEADRKEKKRSFSEKLRF